MNGDFEETAKVKPWLPFVGIIAASALAHLWCLDSQFYMDDITQVRDSDVVRSGHFTQMLLIAWTYFSYHIQYRLFGMSPVGFHAMNWVLHTSVACVVFGFGRDFLRGRWPPGVALLGALLFAVHPLASEIPNYVRTQDLAWVTLFSFLAAWSLLSFFKDGGWWKFVPCGVFILGATFSKGPGLFHALMATGAVGLASASPGHWSFLRRHAWRIGGFTVIMISALWLTGSFIWWSNGVHQWSQPRFISHAYTIARVFWEFAWRSIIPIALSSDHHIAETLMPPGASFWNIPDHGAMFAAVAFLTLAGISVFLAFRKPTRLFGTCMFLYVATILFRVFYPIPEFMPEYRIYPGLPWFCLAAAILLTAAWQWMFMTISPRIPVGLLLGVLIILSARRSFLWHDLDRLMADVLRQYPTQARAVWELDDRDLALGKWQAVIDRQRTVWPEVARRFHEENKILAPTRELPSGHFALAEVACAGHYARALARQETPLAGLREIARLELYMHRLGLDPVAHKIHWDYFMHDKGLVLEIAGKLPLAAACMRRENLPDSWKHDLERVEKKLAELKTQP